MYIMNNIIAIIRDEDFGLKGNELVNPITRYASRGIVFNDNGEIAIFHKIHKNEYKLPGGGINENENKKEAFCREILEETGCKISDIKELGITIEEKGKTNFRQISYIFSAKVIEDTKKLKLTQKEKEEGGELLWLDIDKAYNLVCNCINQIIGSKYDSKYQTLFMVKRDALIINNYLQKNKSIKK